MASNKRIFLKLVNAIRNIRISKHTKLILVSALVGIIVGVTSVGFKYLTEWVQEGAFKHLSELILGYNINIDLSGEKLLEILKNIPPYIVLIVPMTGGLIVGLLLNYFVPEAKGGGVEEVMTSVATKRGGISFKTVIGKLFASSITIGTGGSAGREGPVVQIGGGIGSSIARWLKLNEEHVKTLVGAGVAAGIAAAFNAPIAGAFFALEIILGDFALNTFSTIIIASVSATVANRQLLDYLGDKPFIFSPEIVNSMSNYSLNHVYEFGFYLILAVIAGVVCYAFIKTLFLTENFFTKLKIPPFLKPAVGGLIVGLLAIGIPEVLGVGYDTIEHVILKSGDFTLFGDIWFGLILILGAKIIATSMTLGSGGSGGTIVPSLYLGSVVGAILGVVFQYIVPDLHSNTYAIVGMAAIIAGTTQAPIMAIFLFFEATNNYQIILPVMIVSIITSLITKRLLGGSLYTVKLKEHGINLYEGIEKTVMSTIQVSDIMKQKLYIFHIKTPFRFVIESFLNVHHQVAFIVDDDDKLLGSISLSHMRSIIQEDEVMDMLIAGDLMVEANVYAFPDSNLSYCTELLAEGDMDIIPIVKSDNDTTLIGYLTRKDILSVYNLEVMKKNLSGFKFISKVGDGEQKKYIDLSSKYRVEYITVPKHFINKSIKTLDTRKNYDITILAIENANSDSHNLPKPDTVFDRGDSLIIVGDNKAMDKFLNTI